MYWKYIEKSHYLWNVFMCILLCKQKSADEMLISDWSSDVCSSDLLAAVQVGRDLVMKAAVLAVGRGVPHVDHGSRGWRAIVRAHGAADHERVRSEERRRGRVCTYV